MTLLDSGPSLAFDERAASAVRPRRYERLVVATHRLPSAGGERPDGEPLEDWLGALGPRLAGGGWMGAAGAAPASGELAAAAPPGLSWHAVDLPRQEAADAERFCRRALLPLFHGLPGDCRFEARWWHAYRRTARRFADAVEAGVDPGTLVWAHGPRLTGVAALLRGRWSLARWPAAATPGLAHFLHCPFPPLDHFLALPWRREVLAMLLAHDLLAFESRRDVEHLRECVGALRDDCRVEGAGDGGLIRVPASAGAWREVRLAVVPTGVDFAASSRQAESAEVRLAAERVRAGAGGRRLLVALERLEPASGVLPLLAAYGALLEERPEAARDDCLVLAVEAERDGGGDPAAAELRAEVERRVGEINGRFSRAGCPAVRYLYRRLGASERLALLAAADVIVSAPLKEASARAALAAAAARPDGDGALVVSELSAAAPRLAPDRVRGALAANPYDVDGLAATLRRALELPASERRRRMAFLRDLARREDVGAWVDGCCAAAGLVTRSAAAAPALAVAAAVPAPSLPPASSARRPPRRSAPAGRVEQVARPA